MYSILLFKKLFECNKIKMASIVKDTNTLNFFGYEPR